MPAFFASALAGGGEAAADCGNDADPARRRLAGGPPWYCEKWERDSIEASAAIIMIVVTMMFEHAFHVLQHKVQHSYVYGDSMLSDSEKEAKRNAQVFGKPLLESFLASVGGEFMVLGFLAFTVWSLNQMKFFDFLAKQDFGQRTPTVGSDYLHLVEAVHMQLFLGMVAYFILGFRVVMGATSRNQELETLRRQWIDQLKQGSDNPSPQSDSPSLRTFKIWRDHFLRWGVTQVMQWKLDKPEAFKKVITSMGFGPNDDITEAQLKSAFKGCFSFATYLAFAVREVCLDVIYLCDLEMASILAIKAFLLVVLRLAKKSHDDVVPVFVGLSIVVILVIFVLTEWIKSELAGKDTLRKFRRQTPLRSSDDVAKRKSAFSITERASVFSHKVDVQLMIMRLWQCLLFFVCYSFAGSLISTAFYQDLGHGETTAISTLIGYFFVFGIFLVILPKAVPDFSIVMALPPFFGHTDQELLVHVLSAGGAQGACWAPHIDENNEQMVRARGKLELLNAVRDLVERGRKAKGAEDSDDIVVEPVPFLSQLQSSRTRHLDMVSKKPNSAVRSAEEQVVDDLYDMLTQWQEEEVPQEDVKIEVEEVKRLSMLHEVLQQGKTVVRQEYQSARTSHLHVEGHPLALQLPAVAARASDSTSDSSSDESIADLKAGRTRKALEKPRPISKVSRSKAASDRISFRVPDMKKDKCRKPEDDECTEGGAAPWFGSEGDHSGRPTTVTRKAKKPKKLKKNSSPSSGLPQVKPALRASGSA